MCFPVFRLLSGILVAVRYLTGPGVDVGWYNMVPGRFGLGSFRPILGVGRFGLGRWVVSAPSHFGPLSIW